MQAALTITPPILPLSSSKNAAQMTIIPPKLGGSLASRCSAIKATSVAYDPSTVDYSSSTSVFPAEACETIGGEACLADIYPEAKLKPEPGNKAARIAVDTTVDRDYLEYNDPKTYVIS
uniref:Light-regulated protein n=1 Tax=Rhizophora mucronata TaxID=61149 RepID=A0A2P2KV38_RHIMU